MKIRTKNRQITLSKYYIDANFYENNEYRRGFCIPITKLKHNKFLVALWCLFKPIEWVIDKNGNDEL